MSHASFPAPSQTPKGPKTFISVYVRNNRKERVGYLVARKDVLGDIYFGWAFWHKKKDPKYDRDRMRNIAFARSMKGDYAWQDMLLGFLIPRKYIKQVDIFALRAFKYFKVNDETPELTDN